MSDARSTPCRSVVILVVERDPHVRELEAYFLREAGFDVEFALDGDAAWGLIQERRPAMVITEVLVPRMDGLALCRRIKMAPELSRTLVVVFSMLAAAGRAREAGADAFLMKPLAERQLLRTIEGLLDARKEAQA